MNSQEEIVERLSKYIPNNTGFFKKIERCYEDNPFVALVLNRNRAILINFKGNIFDYSIGDNYILISELQAKFLIKKYFMLSNFK